MNKTLRLLLLMAGILLFPAAHAADEIRTLDVSPYDLAYDTSAHVLYAILKNYKKDGKYTLNPIDPEQGTTGEPIPLGAEPLQLAISSDYTALYVSLRNSTVVRMSLPNQTVGVPFSLGSDPDGSAYSPVNLVVVPDNSDAVVIYRRTTAPGKAYRGAALYVNGVQQGVATPDNIPLGRFLFGDASDTLYGLSSIVAPNSFYRMTVDEGGVKIKDTTELNTDLGELSYAKGRIYSSFGSIIDPALPAVEEGIEADPAQLALADAASNRIFIMNFNPPIKIYAYNLTSRLPLGTLTLDPGPFNPSHLVRWGKDGLAFCSLGPLYLIRSSLLPPEGTTADLSLSQEAPEGPATTGVPRTYTLTITNQGPDAATGIMLKDEFSAESGLVSATPSQGTCSAVQNTVTCTVGDLVSQAKATVSLVLVPVMPEVFRNTARIGGFIPDPDAANNSSTLDTTVQFGLGPNTASALWLPTNDLVYDSLRQKIYASIPARAGEHGNSIAVIDPATGAMGPYIPAGIEPNRLAISGDASTLYVGLDGEAAVRRFSLDTFTPDLKFDLLLSNGDMLDAEDMEVLPDQPKSVAISRKIHPMEPSNLSNHYDVAVYDDGKLRGATPPGTQTGEQLEFGETASDFYSFVNGFALYRMEIEEDGVTVIDAAGDLFKESNAIYQNLDVHSANGLLYSSTRRVIDPMRRTVIGSFTGGHASLLNLVRPDLAADRVFFLDLPFGKTLDDTHYVLRANGLSTRLPIDTMNIPGKTSVPSSLLRWGTDGLAFRTSADQLYLIRTALMPPPAPAVDLSLSVTAAPDPVTVGTPLTYTATVTNLSADAATGVMLESDFLTDAKFVSVMSSQGTCAPFGTAASPSTAVSCTLGTLEAGASAQVTLALAPLIAPDMVETFRAGGFQSDPDLANNQFTLTSSVIYSLLVNQSSSLRLAANDLAYDARRGKLYASLAGDAYNPGTDFAVIDPAIGKIEATLLVGSNPRVLALSDDGKYLYVALEGSASVKRIDLDTMTLDLEFPVGKSLFDDTLYAMDMEVMPGHPETVAIVRKNPANSGPTGGVAVYDNGVQRPKAEQYLNVVGVIGFKDPTEIYGHSGAPDNFELFRMDVQADGVPSHVPAALDYHSESPQRFGVNFRTEGGYLLSAAGVKFDLNAKELAGVFDGAQDGRESLVVPDVSEKRVYFVRGTDQNGASQDHQLEAYDLDTLALLGAQAIPGEKPQEITDKVKSLVRWGRDGVAFIGANHRIFVARSSLISGVYGDVNQDRKFDISDVVEVLQFAVAIRAPGPEEAALADVAPKPGLEGRPNGDGKIDVQDAVRLLKALVGLDTLP